MQWPSLICLRTLKVCSEVQLVAALDEFEYAIIQTFGGEAGRGGELTSAAINV